MQKIVLIGGGSGVSEMLTEFSRKKNLLVTAVVTVFDDGGSTGRLRKVFGIPAVGDLRKCLSAASGLDFLELRLPSGHAVGNLILATLTQQIGFPKAVQFYAQMLSSKVVVLPVSFTRSSLIMRFDDESELRGESQLDHPPKKFLTKRIKKIRLAPSAKINPAVKKALLAADKIIVGPGSLFGSLLPHFLVSDFAEIFSQARGQKFFVANGTSEFGCPGESAEQRAARFGVRFDKILKLAPHQKRWNPKQLVKKILV